MQQGRGIAVGMRRRPSVLFVAAALLAVGLGSPAQADDPIPGSCKLHTPQVVNPGCAPALTSELRQPGITLPNLVPNVETTYIVRPFVIDENGTTVPTGPPRLFFDTWVQNLGTVPLQLAFEGVEDPQTAAASQCVSWTSRICREQRPVGGFSWHDEHTHFHYNEFADYQLRRLGPDGRPDYSDAGFIGRSEKVSFCLMDSRQVDPDAPPTPPSYLTCTPTVEGVSPGWTDIYAASREGQQLSLEGLSDGRYSLIISIDYADRIYETDNSDNVVEATLEISGGVTAVSVVERHYP